MTMTMTPHEAQCKRIKLYRRFVVALLLLYIPVAFPISVLLFKSLHTLRWSFLFAAVWLAGWLVSALLLGFSRCPNCSKRFLKYWWFSKVCAHCGFRC